jgi:hypothetical protein
MNIYFRNNRCGHEVQKVMQGSWLASKHDQNLKKRSVRRSPRTSIGSSVELMELEKPEVNYRLVCKGDLDFDKCVVAVATLDRECTNEFLIANPWTLETYKEQVQQWKRCGVAVAEINNEIVGAFLWGIEEETPKKIQLQICAVKKAYRQLGM